MTESILDLRWRTKGDFMQAGKFVIGIGGISRLAILCIVGGLALSGAPEGSSDARQHEWAVRFDRLVKEPPGWTAVERHETNAVAFSPGDNRIAVTLTHHQRVAERKFWFNTHLLILEINSPEDDVRQFDLSDNCGVDLTWNNRGDMLLVCGTILHVANGATCPIRALPPRYQGLSREFAPYHAHWLDSDHVVRWTGEILDLDCKQVGTWPMESTWHIGAVADTKGWVLLYQTEGQPQNFTCQYSIVDSSSHEVLNGWPTRKMSWPCGKPVMAIGADAVCFTGFSNKLYCREINSEREITAPKQIRDYILRQAATASPRMIVEKWESDRDPWWALLFTWLVPTPDSPALPRRRLVVDLRSGSVVSSWKPLIQNSTSPHVEDWPYHCAISANGDLLAESGNGGLELFRLP
jgi:hypothetical protein